jgi:hypothetical protein
VGNGKWQVGRPTIYSQLATSFNQSLVPNLPLGAEWLFLHLKNNPAQISQHIKMDFSYPGILVSACAYIHICIPGLV